MAIPVIYKGDDTDFRGESEFTLRIKSAANLTGCTVEVELLGYCKAFPASATGELVCPFVFTAKETAAMPLGIHVATVRVYDAKGRVRTINNSIRVKVTNVLSEAYGKDDPNEVTLKISTLDLEGYARTKDIPDVSDFAKKKDVKSAIADAMKSVSASTQLHALPPEVTDTTVTLKPIDGAANYVGGKIEGMPGKLVPIGDSIFDIYLRGDLRTDDGTWVGTFDAREYSLYGVFAFEYVGHNGIDTAKYRITVLQDFVVNDCDNNMPFFKFIKGKTGEFHRTIFSDEFEERDKYIMGNIQWDLTPWDVLGEYVYNYPSGANPEFYTASFSGYYETELTPSKTPVITIPESTDVTKARKFTIAVETDTDTEKAVEWQGGEVIEALPGASKLVPGFNVWDVAEVAPGKFKVERASNPAQSVPLTLTAPNGRVAELVVNDDLVLEVKEIE